jgi:hypothetical protein
MIKEEKPSLVEVKHDKDGSPKVVSDDIGYDDISDDELDDLIGGAEDDREEKSVDKTAVVDILDIKWESLMQQERSSKAQSSSGSALTRFKAYNIFSSVGVSAAFAGSSLVQKIKQFCQQQMTDDIAVLSESATVDSKAAENMPLVKSEPNLKTEPTLKTEPSEMNVMDSTAADAATTVPELKPFEFLDPVADFHASLMKKLNERVTLVTNIGQYRRALCARRDLAMRRALCKVDKDDVVIYPAQSVDHDLYKLSQQLFHQDRDRRPSIIPVSAAVPTAIQG